MAGRITQTRRMKQAAPRGARRTQGEARKDLLRLQRLLQEGATIAEIRAKFHVSRSRAYDMIKQVEHLVSKKVKGEGRGASRKLVLDSPDPFNLVLRDEEVLPALIMLRDASYSLFSRAMGKAKNVGVKLEQRLDERTRANYRRVSRRVSLRFLATKSIGEGPYTTVLTAMAEGRALRFHYARAGHCPSLLSPEGRRHLQEEWHAEPWAIIYVRRHFYVIVRPLTDRAGKRVRRGQHSDLRTLKLSRLDGPRMSDATFEVPSTFTVDGYLSEAWGIVREEGAPLSKVVIDLAPEAAENLVDTEWHPTQHVERNADGSVARTEDGMVRMEFRVRGVSEIKYWVLTQGRFARVVKPESLRQAVLDELRQMAANHAGPARQNKETA